MERLYRNVMITTSVVMFVLTSLFYLYSVDMISAAYVDHAGDIILEDKKNIMRDTVNNLIREIDAERHLQLRLYEDVVFRKAVMLQTKLADAGALDEERENELLIDFFENDKSSIVSDWYLLIWDHVEQKEIYDSDDILRHENWNGSVMGLDVPLTVYRKIIRGDRTIVYSIGPDTIRNAVQERVVDRIRATKFENDGYIWINEVLDYDGGDRYAVRRVHPAFPDTEGQYLSTYTSDGFGSFPYKDELEGIKKDGEAFYRYFFRRDRYREPEEKISYAKLYKQYDWIICMGAYLDDIDEYAAYVQEKNKALIDRLVLARTGLFVVIVLGAFGTLFLINRWMMRKSFQSFEHELGRDVLTLSESRRGGVSRLEKDFLQFKKDGRSPVILMLDIDHFKGLNDTYGHDFGDRVLKSVVNEIYGNIRNSDRLIRWGGDEFVGIFYGLREDNCLSMGDKILKAVESLTFEHEGKQVRISVSMGFSAFRSRDDDFMEAVKRADAALYDAKQAGRGRACVRM